MEGRIAFIRSAVEAGGTRRMKVCFIVGTLGRGGAEKQLVFMLRALKSSGVEPRILCLTKGEAYESEIESLGIDVEFVGQSQNRLIRLIKIIRSLRKRPAEIIQSSHFYTNIYAGLAGKILRIPSIGAIRSNLRSELKINGFLGAYQISLPSFLIANSNFGRELAIENGILPEKIAFVRNVVDIPDESAGDKSGETVTFLFVGRLGKEKRADRFIRLAGGLVERFPNVSLRFRIAGDGPLRSELEKQAGQHSLLSGKIEFLGELGDMKQVYAEADALVLTSDYEGTPNVILEAMAHGLPVLATRVGGTPEILNENCGMLVERDDEFGLLESASRLVDCADLRKRMGSEGRRYALGSHSITQLSAQLEKIYSGLVSPDPVAIKPALGEKASSR